MTDASPSHVPQKLHSLWGPLSESSSGAESHLKESLYLVLTSVEIHPQVANDPKALPFQRVFDHVQAASAAVGRRLGWSDTQIGQVVQLAGQRLRAHSDEGMMTVSATMPTRPHGISSDLHGSEVGLRQADAVLSAAVFATRDDTTLVAFADDEVLSLLALTLILRCGVCTNRVLRPLLLSLSSPLVLADHWTFSDVTATASVGDSGEERRVWLDVTTAAIRIRASKRLLDWRATLDDLPHAVQRRRLSRLLSSGFKKLWIRFHPGTPAPSAFALMRWSSTKISKTLTLLSEYASGRIVSSCLSRSSLARLIGANVDLSESKSTQKPSDSLPQHPPSADDELERLEAEPNFKLITRLRAVFDLPRTEWLSTLEELRLKVSRDDRITAEALLVDWAMVISSDPKAGKRPGTLKGHIGRIGSRWLSQTRNVDLNSISPEDFRALSDELLENTASDAHAARLSRTYGHFIRTIWSQLPFGGDPLCPLPSATAGYAVSRDVMSLPELYKAIELLWQRFESGQELAEQAAVLTELGGLAGMRRGEIWGLQRRDLHPGTPFVLTLGDNELRELKTNNSVRKVPLVFISRLASAFLYRRHSNPSSLDPTATKEVNKEKLGREAIFIDSAGARREAGVIAIVREVLREVTGDPNVHPHTLRHSFATWLLWAVTYKLLGLDRFLDNSPWLAAIRDFAERIPPQLFSPIREQGAGLEAISAFLGHGAPQTSLKHYIHGLDFLLFAAVDRSAERGSQELEKAALTLAPASRLHGRSSSSLLMPLVRSLAIEVDDWRTECLSTMAESRPDSPPKKTLTLSDLVEHWKAFPSPNHSDLNPQLLAQSRPLAQAVLDILLAGVERDPVEAKRLLSLWASKRSKGKSKSSIPGAEILAFSKLFFPSSGMRDQWMEIQRIGSSGEASAEIYPSWSKLKRMIGKNPGKHFYVRLSRRDRERMKSATTSTGFPRSDKQALITWLIVCIASYLSNLEIAG